MNKAPMSNPSDETFNSSMVEQINHPFYSSIETTLLCEMRKAKSLYCSHDPDFNNLAKNRLHWLMIAEKCKKTVSECVKRWHSLLRIYFSSPPEETAWIHIESFKKFEPFLSNHRLQIPSKNQRFLLLKELCKNSKELHKPGSTPEEHENIWLQIVSKCNAITPGVIMSNLNWQKYWVFHVKQSFGVRMYTKHYGKNSDVTEKYTDEEIKIIEICRANAWDSNVNIIKALGKNFELGTSKANLIIKCKKCLKQCDEILYQGCCSKCCEIPLFCSICEIGGSVIKFKLAEWSKQALDLLPIELASSKEISACSKCSNELNKKATNIWKVCRVCTENQSSYLESLYFDKTNEKMKNCFNANSKCEFNDKDGLPGYICTNCKVQVKEINEFCKRFKQTQNILMQIRFKNFIDKSFDEPKEEEIQSNSVSHTNRKTNIIKSAKAAEVAPSKLISKIRVLKKNSIGSKNVFNITPTVKPASYKIISTQKCESNQFCIKVDGTKIVCTPPGPPELAIKDVFSLPPSNQQNRINSNTKVVPVAISQAGKINSIRTLVDKIKASKPLQSNPKLNDNALSVPKSAAASMFSTKISMNTKIIPPPDLRTAKPQELIPLLQKSGTNTAMTLKPTAASKPAIFTIPMDASSGSSEPASTSTSTTATDYETIEDAPPVFCIPKYVVKTNDFPSNGDIQLMDFSPSPSKVIKIEKPDADDVTEIPTTTIDVPIGKSIKIPKAPSKWLTPTKSTAVKRKYNRKIIRPNLNPASAANIKKPDDDVDYPGTTKTPAKRQYRKKSSTVKRKNTNKVVRINGDLVIVKPHPYYRDAYVPADFNEEQDSGGTRLIRKVNTSKKAIPLEQPTDISQAFKPANRIGKRVIKKPRKYWGTVDEFQVAALTEKIQPAIPLDLVKHNPNSTKSTTLVESSDGGPASSEDPSNHDPLKIQIKQEILYTEDFSENALASNQNQNSIFDRNTDSKNLRKNHKLKSPFKLKKLSVNLKKEKRVPLMDSDPESKKLCLI